MRIEYGRCLVFAAGLIAGAGACAMLKNGKAKKWVAAKALVKGIELQEKAPAARGRRNLWRILSPRQSAVWKRKNNVHFNMPLLGLGGFTSPALSALFHNLLTVAASVYCLASVLGRDK